MKIDRTIFISALLAAPLMAWAASPLANIRVGASASVTLDLPAGTTAAPVADDADLIVSVALNPGSAATVTVIPTRAGNYDLRDSLRGPGGAAVSIDRPLPVSSFSTLPPGDDLTLKPINRTPLPRLGGYKAVAAAAVAVWSMLLIPLVFWKRPRRIRIIPQIVVETPPPTLDQQMRALAARFRQGDPTTAEKVKLETLVIGHFRHRLNLGDLAMDVSLRHLRHSAEAGSTIEGLERTFHAPAPEPLTSATIDVLLAQYQADAKGRD